MITLAIDSAGFEGRAALARGAPDDLQIFTETLPPGRGQAEQALDMVDQLFVKSATEWAALGRIIVVVGPGSFTGVRVGVALAKGFALASGAPLLGIYRTQLVATAFERALKTGGLGGGLSGTGFSQARLLKGGVFEGHFASLLLAGRGELYAQIFHHEGDGFAPLAGPHLVAGDEVKSYLAQHKVNLLVGCYEAGMVEFLSLCDIELPYIDVRLGGEDFFLLKDHLYLQNDEVKPLYLRAPDAKPQLGKALKRRQP